MPSAERDKYRFGDFLLDVSDRQLWRGSERVDLNARYLDALVFLVRHEGQLVEKGRLFEVVWDDVVVSDSALTQCIKEIRKQLGDQATNPRFIQTVPRHGYRFVGEVEIVAAPQNGPHAGLESASTTAPSPTPSPTPNPAPNAAPDPTQHPPGPPSPHLISSSNPSAIWKTALFETGAGTLGGGFAGLLGGIFYGFGLASAGGGVGTFSTLLVLVSLTELAGIIGGFGVSVGFAAAGIVATYLPQMRTLLRIGGAMFGGLLVGAMAKLLGMDAFNLLFGHTPAGITGGPEGAVLGGALALGAYLGAQLGRRVSGAKRWHATAGAGVLCGTAGALIPLFGGRLMGGSLDILARSFADSRLQLDTLGPLFGELHFGQATQISLGGLEGVLFGVGVIGALTLLRRSSVGNSAPPDTGI